MKRKYHELMWANLVLMVVSLGLTGWYVYRFSTLGGVVPLVYALICIGLALWSLTSWNTYRKRLMDEE